MRLTEWAEERSLLPESQFGFRENRRTIDCIFILNTLIESTLSKHNTLYVCYVDFKKAFDCVDHSLLWTKLINLGISHKILAILQSMYAAAASCIKISKYEVTDQFPCQKGVRQGCILSPLLFSLFISDLETELRHNESGVKLNRMAMDLLMYADDIVLISSSAAGLRKNLYVLQSYCKTWKLEINIDKTKICVFGRDLDRQVFKWKQSVLEKVQEYKYLGVWITSNGKFNKTRRYLASQAKKAAFALLAISVRLNHPSVTVMFRLYDALITPIMSYGCEIWGFKEDRDLEKVEIKFLKSILHLPDSTPTMAVRGELGQLPIFLLWKERILKYWNRLCSENIPIFLREAASLSLHNATAGKQSWAMNTASIFNHAGYSSSFFEGNGCDRELTNRLMSVYRDQFIQTWNSYL